MSNILGSETTSNDNNNNNDTNNDGDDDNNDDNNNDDDNNDDNNNDDDNNDNNDDLQLPYFPFSYALSISSYVANRAPKDLHICCASLCLYLLSET